MRTLFRLWARLRWWQHVCVFALTPVVALNLMVALVGHSAVNPLSPFHLSQKAHAVLKYAGHRPRCVWAGHPPMSEVVRAAERKAGLPRGLMEAVVFVESGNRAHRISHAGAMGPAQLMPMTAAELGVADPFDPQESIDAGARYLKRLLDRTRRVDLAVAAYNAGPGAVQGRIPEIAETQAYVSKVMQRWAASRAGGG